MTYDREAARAALEEHIRERTHLRAAVTQQIVLELAREAVDAHVLDQPVSLPERLWAAIEADEDMQVTDIALAAIDLFGALIEHIAHLHGMDHAAGILTDISTDHAQHVVTLAQRMAGNTR